MPFLRLCMCFVCTHDLMELLLFPLCLQVAFFTWHKWHSLCASPTDHHRQHLRFSFHLALASQSFSGVTRWKTHPMSGPQGLFLVSVIVEHATSALSTHTCAYNSCLASYILSLTNCWIELSSGRVIELASSARGTVTSASQQQLHNTVESGERTQTL